MTYQKSLRIMRDVHYEKGVNDSLMSPPLTPTEVHHPTLSAINAEEEEEEDWYYPRRGRKEFITSYSKMVPFLRKSNNNNHGSMFALNVYRDLLLSNKGNATTTTTTATPVTTINNKINKKKENDCTMLDETVVPHSRKRKLSFTGQAEEEQDSNKKKRKRVSSVLPTGKEAALAFDAIDIDSTDEEFYPNGWVPFKEALDQVPVKVCWKGAPLLIHQQPYYNELHKVEASMASILRLSPIQYLRCKRTLILAARTLKLQQIPFTKSVAQKLCRVDVNKTSALWTAFGQLGWFNESHAN